MDISVEYLSIFGQSGSFCDSATSFMRLLQVDSAIVVSNGMVSYKGIQSCAMQLSAGKVTGKDQRYFQLKFIWNGDPDADTDALDRFLSLLKAVRRVLVRANCAIGVETLRDDVSSHFARKAYQLIQEIENLMRRLIANFMLVNVGLEWTTEVLPGKVEDAIRNKKRKNPGENALKKGKERDYLNVLHTLDFIHLGDIFFNAYSKKTSQDLYAKLKDVNTVKEVAALQDFIPKSNWQRYFTDLIKCDDSYLESRWKRLYDLRCKVAHNALITRTDYDDIRKLIDEVKPKLLDAIEKLPQVTVPPDEMETVAESAVRSVNAAVGEFIGCWQQLESLIARRGEASGVSRRRKVFSGHELCECGILDHLRADQYEEVRHLRNQIVHGSATDVPVEKLQIAAEDIRSLIERVESESYIAWLKKVKRGDLETEIDAILSDTLNEITESEEFGSEMATTNACAFSVDDYDILDIDVGDDECIVRISYAASGEQMEDKAYYGDWITGEAEAIVDRNGSVQYQNVTAEVDQGDRDDDHEEYDPGDGG